MMGVNTLSEQVLAQITGLDSSMSLLKDVDPKLMKIYFTLKQKSGVTLPIKSAARNEKENKDAGGAKGSSHLKGLAFDIHFDTPQKELIKKLIGYASEAGALGIGVYKDGQDLHIDIDSSKGGRRAWGPSYSPSDIPDWAKVEVQKHLNGEYIKNK